ncbi:MAG: VOC family protein [Burkholderiales bacterium]|nr:VOC family protein [Burkholderiales bacterium]
MICVPDLERGADAYRRMGFNIQPGGVHPGKGTHNAIAFNEEDYVELLAIRDPAEERAASAGAGSWGTDLPGFVAAGGGIRYVIVQSDDLDADVAAMRGRGVDVTDPLDGRRIVDDGHEFRWKAARLGPGNPLPVFFIQHLTPMEERRAHTPAAGPHPNGVRFLERVYIVVNDLEASVALYAKVLGAPAPRMYKGTVIMSHMAVFQYGAAGLTIAHPYAPGPAAESLERRGEGPFQALFRTTSMGAAARWMERHGMPPPARGVRDTGEHAMLVAPAHACGAYIGFVGPE